MEKLNKCRAGEGTKLVKNGHRSSRASRKQSWKCNECGFQGVENPSKKVIEKVTRILIQKVLLERLSLHGICRVFDISMRWLTWFSTSVCKAAPKDLCVRFEKSLSSKDLVFELDEMWTFVGKKENKVWVWMVMERSTRQIIAFAVGDRSAATCEKWWEQSAKIGVKGILYTDLWRAYALILPET